MTKQQQFLSYAHAFLVAADGHATAAKEKGVYGEVDGMMCIIALQNSVVGAARTLGKGHHAVQQYSKVAGDLKDVRDMLVHFDAYAVGDGKLQEKAAGVAQVSKKNESVESEVFGWMTQWATDETMIILNRRKGDFEATLYEVPIHAALRNVAILVAVGVKSIREKPSPLLRRLTADGGAST